MDAPTLRVVSTDESSQGPFVVIDAAAYDPEVHTLYDASQPQQPAKRRGRPPKVTSSEA
jgi:hypothetical protein